MLRVGVKINYFPQVNWFPTIIDRDCVFLRTALSFIINTYFDNFVSINDWEEPIYLNPNTQKILLKTSKKHPVVSQRGLDCIESSGSSDTFKCYIPVALNCNWVVNSDSIQVRHLVGTRSLYPWGLRDKSTMLREALGAQIIGIRTAEEGAPACTTRLTPTSTVEDNISQSHTALVHLVLIHHAGS